MVTCVCTSTYREQPTDQHISPPKAPSFREVDPSRSPAMSDAEQQKPFVTGGVIDGKAVAAAIREETAATVGLLKEKHGKVSDSWSGAAVGSSGVSFPLTIALQFKVLWHMCIIMPPIQPQIPFMLRC
jgi:hypothetical protein